MKITPFESRFASTPFIEKDRARWTLNSTKAVGRSSKPGYVEVAIGTGAFGRGSRGGHHIDCFVLPLTDQQMRRFAAAEARATRLPDLADVMAELVELGVPSSEASRVLGLSPADGSRLRAISGLEPKVKAALREPGRTLNHARWILGLREEDALKGLKARFEGKPLSVARLRSWRTGLGKQAGQQGHGETSGKSADALRAEKSLGERLGTRLEIAEGADGRSDISIGYWSIETLQGVLVKLLESRGDAPPYPAGAPGRWLTLTGLSNDEQAFLLGSVDD